MSGLRTGCMLPVSWNTAVPASTFMFGWLAKSPPEKSIVSRCRPRCVCGMLRPGTRSANMLWTEEGAFRPRVWYHNIKYLRDRGRERENYRLVIKYQLIVYYYSSPDALPSQLVTVASVQQFAHYPTE